MTKNQKEQIEIIADQYGIEKQLGKTLEELRELTVEVKNYRDLFVSGNDDIKTERIVDEIADVKIMIRQLVYFLELKEDIKDRVDYKLTRQLYRINDEYQEDEYVIGWNNRTGSIIC